MNKKPAKSRKAKIAQPAEPITIDGRGIAWIAGTQVKVIEIVLDKLAHGGSVKEIRAHFDRLTQKQVREALEYYREHQDQFQMEIEKRWRQINQLGVREADSPFQRRLREMRKKA